MFIRYTAKSGDTLSAIAQKLLGNANRLHEILDEYLQEIGDKNSLEAGQVMGRYAGSNAFEQDKGLAKADLLRGRVAQLSRTIFMQIALTGQERFINAKG